MVRASAYFAILMAVFLAIAEAVRNWGDWQWWPFWVVDYFAALFLLAGALHYLQHRRKSWLCGGWGFFTAMSYMSFFNHIEFIRNDAGGSYGAGGGISELTITTIIGVMLVVSSLALLGALLGKGRD